MSKDPNANEDGKAKRDGTIQSVSVAVRFLDILADAQEPLALGEIARRTESGTSSAHRYLQSLLKEGLANQDPVTGYYDLGPKALRIGTAALKRIDPVEIAARHMKDLANQIASSGGIAIWTDRGPTLVRWYRSALFSISSLGLGDILPVDNSACGHVFQAFLPEIRINEARKNQPAAFAGSPPAHSALETIRADRYAELSGHLLPQITGQAVPVFDAQGEIACVMTTIANLGYLNSPDDLDLLREKARLVAQESGGATS